MCENPVLSVLKEKNTFFFRISAAYGILFALFCYKNTNGIAFFIETVITVVWGWLCLQKLGMKAGREAVFWWSGILILGVSTVMTDSGILIFLNWLGIVILFIMGMISCFFGSGRWNVFMYMRTVLVMGLRSCLSSFRIFQFRKSDDCILNEKNEEDKIRIWNVIKGVAAAGILLLIILPLLISSDRVFAGIFKNIFRLPEYLDFHNAVPAILTAVCMMMLFFGVFYAFCASADRPKEMEVQPAERLTGITCTGILAAVYLLYCAVQVIFLFMKNAGGLSQGVTYSEYAREGFWQLLFVGIINIVLVLVCGYLFKKDRILGIILTVISGCTMFMNLSAAYRMILYVNEYGMTFLRVLVLWFLLLMIFFMAGIVIFIHKADFPVMNYLAVCMAAGYIILSFLHPDALAASYNLKYLDRLTAADAVYMIENLSWDAAPVLAEIDIDSLDYSDGIYTKEQVRNSMEEYFMQAAVQDQQSSMREFNLSRRRAADCMKKIWN